MTYWWMPVSQRQFNTLSTKVSKLMAAQDDINTAVLALKGVVTDLTGTVQTLADEFAALQNQAGVPVDTSALETAVTSLQGVQTALDSLATANAPAPADPAAPAAKGKQADA
jgi:ribosomal protein L12E/L44/L45/RPP1/RPP2